MKLLSRASQKKRSRYYCETQRLDWEVGSSSWMHRRTTKVDPRVACQGSFPGYIPCGNDRPVVSSLGILANAGSGLVAAPLALQRLPTSHAAPRSNFLMSQALTIEREGVQEQTNKTWRNRPQILPLTLSPKRNKSAKAMANYKSSSAG